MHQRLRESARAEASGSFHRCNDLTVDPVYADLLGANGLDSLDALFAVADAEILGKPGLDPSRQRLRLILRIDGEPSTFYLKRFSHPSASMRRDLRLCGNGASSTAGMEWTWLRRLREDGIPSPRPVAFGEDLGGSRERRSAVLTAAVPGISLETLAARWTVADRPTVRRLIAPLAELVRRFHDAGYVHRDLYLSHVYYDPAADQPLHFIDVQRVFRPIRRQRWIVKDLAALNFSAPAGIVSRTDRFRWLKQYLGAPKLTACAKVLMYRVIGKTQGMARRRQRRGTSTMRGRVA